MEEKAWQSYAMLLYIHSNILVLEKKFASLLSNRFYNKWGITWAVQCKAKLNRILLYPLKGLPYIAINLRFYATLGRNILYK